MLGLRLFLGSISMFFLAAIAAYFWVRRAAPSWPPLDAPDLPRWLWLSTFSLIGVSLLLQRAVATARRGDSTALMPQIRLAAICVLLFVIGQIISWIDLIRADTTFERHLYGFTFYMLTGLHGLHVLGGVVSFIVMVVRTRCGAYQWTHTGSLRYIAVYWHYLLGVWVVLYAILLLDR